MKGIEEQLTHALLDYESDTFSASGSGLTLREAQDMAKNYAESLKEVVQCGGSLTFDGTVHAATLEEIREKG